MQIVSVGFDISVGFVISCILSAEDSLHETSNPNFRENKKNIISLSYAELVHRVVKVKYSDRQT